MYEKRDSKKPFHISVKTALSRIINGDSKDKIDAIRGGDKTLKDELPCVIFSGYIDDEGEKVAENVKKHTGFICLDFDNVEPELKKSQLKKDSYIYAAWVSPSGNGVKALIRTPPNKDHHEMYFNSILSRYPELDKSGRNINRLCYESYDPELYFNKGSLVWDKTMTTEEYTDWKSKRENKRAKRVTDIAVSMIRNARVGERHDTILKASHLCGGHHRLFDEKAVKKQLKEAVKSLGFPSNELPTELKAVDDGYAHGKTMPIQDIKEIEHTQDFTKRADGSYDFLADEEEMDEYEYKFINGMLEMGLPTGMPKLDEHWLFKRNTLVWMGGISNIGKSFSGWYLSVVAAMLHDWKFLIYSKENRDGQVRKKLKEFYIGKSIKTFTVEEKQDADRFISEHFKLFTAKRMHTMEDFLLKCEIIYDEGYEYDCIFAEPFNAFEVPRGTQEYSHLTHVLNQLQTFKENYSAIWISDHVGTQAARNKENDGSIKVPWKSDIEMGARKDGKTDDFIILHRHTQDPARESITEFHVQKIKDRETGGKWTPADQPVELIANKDLCGFSCNAVDPVVEYWQRKGKQPPTSTKPSEASKRLGGWDKPTESIEAPF